MSTDRFRTLKLNGALHALCAALCLASLWCPDAACAAGSLSAASGKPVHALVIGIDDYSHVPKLEGAVADARDIAQSLQSAGVRDVTLLTDSKVTRSSFLEALEDLLARSQPDELAVISYAGHGATVPAYPQFAAATKSNTNEEFLMPGFGLSGPSSSEVIVNNEMKALLSRFDKKNVDVLFIADSCFGGGMVRGLPDPRVARFPVRFVRDAAVHDQSRFKPIEMTEEEKAVDIANLRRVTFVSGTDRFTVVPEVFIPKAPFHRGALSYAMARVLEGAAFNGKHDTALTRLDLFVYARQEVQHFSDNQRIDGAPDFLGAKPSALLQKTILRFSDADKKAGPDTLFTDQVVPVSVAVMNGDASKEPRLPSPYAVHAGNALNADLIWDVKKRQILQKSGDVLASDVEDRQVADIAMRTYFVRNLNGMMIDDPQVFGLADGNRRYTPNVTPVLQAKNVAARYLIVFDVTYDGRVQVVYPSKTDGRVDSDIWAASPPVIPPFGADFVVAISARAFQKPFLDWLNANENSDPGRLADLLSQIRKMKRERADVRVGAVTLYSAARQ